MAINAELKERIDSAVALAYGQQGYMTAEGEFDMEAIEDRIFALVVKAEATTLTERASVCITRRGIMEHIFPKMAGPAQWASQDDPEVAEGAYMALDSTCRRRLGTAPGSQIQKRLNGDRGLILCHTKKNEHNTDSVYVTRNLDCLLEDVIKAQRAAEKTRADRDAAFTVMLIERIPEHAKQFHKQLVGGLTTALNGAKALSAGALDALVQSGDDDDE